MDFVSARTADGRWFRTLTVLDVYTALRPRRSSAAELEALADRLELELSQ